MASPLSRLDDGVARLEKVAVLGCLAVMTAAVFLDVVHRVASSPDGLVLRLLLLFAGDDPSEGTREILSRWIAPGIIRLVGFGVIFAALRTARDSTFSRMGAGAIAAGILLAIEVVVRLMLSAFPHGLVWSQPLALSMLLWVALLGATLATKERAHIVLQIADRLWAGPALRYVRLGSGLLAGGFCLVLALLGAHYTADFYEQWSDGVGYVSGISIPRWTVYLAIPVCFSVMAIRFAGYAVGDFLKGVDPTSPTSPATDSAEATDAAGVSS